MEPQTELWSILQDDEYNYVWDRIDSEFRFHPSVRDGQPAFQFKVPADVYDISELPLEDDSYRKMMDQVFVKSFIECMGSDGYMYALDWQHSGFRYNPRITAPKRSAFIHDNRYANGGYNAFFPSFYPDGDYYFFISKDFLWGYLTHPWQKKAWVFGRHLQGCIRKRSSDLQFVP